MIFSRQRYIDSLAHPDDRVLASLERRMVAYYAKSPYHSIFVKGANINWTESSHAAQIAMCQFIPQSGRVLEVGSGDGGGANEIIKRLPNCSYFEVDLSERIAGGRRNYSAASAYALPFGNAIFDAVISMFTLEHLVFPIRFLKEAWRVLAIGGTFLTIAPDFARNGMQSERIGLSYGSGREKIQSRRYLDALLTTFDSRLRLPIRRRRRLAQLRRGTVSFPILTEPRCLHLPDFVPDCDAVYSACPEEIALFMGGFDDCGESNVFYRDGSTFGLGITKM